MSERDVDRLALGVIAAVLVLGGLWLAYVTLAVR